VGNFVNSRASTWGASAGVTSNTGTSRDLAQLYSLHARSLGRLAYLLVADRHLAEDLVNDTFVRVATHLWKLRDPRAIESYLRRTLVNLAHASGRRRMREQRFNATVVSREAKETFPHPIDYVEHHQLIIALNRLPSRQKAALVLRYYEDLSEHQVADILDVPLGTVKTLVFRGKKKLRNALEDDS
jgi:RNA polymerase sigma-70 factor (sigma-E family)